MQPINVDYKGYLITTDKTLLQPEAVHQWLATESYWSKHAPFSIVKKAFDNSYCIGVLKDGKQIAYARLITDYATYAYLADVYVEELHRGIGLSKKIMEILLELDWVKGMRAIKLATRDMQPLYSQFGFTHTLFPERQMEIVRPNIYGDENNPCR
jgi:GNAT superfamily N-acetyltransferase